MNTKNIKPSLILWLFALLPTLGGCAYNKSNENEINTLEWRITMRDLTEMREILPFFEDPSFELELYNDGKYEIDLDFDKIKEKLIVDSESNFKVSIKALHTNLHSFLKKRNGESVIKIL